MRLKELGPAVSGGPGPDYCMPSSIWGALSYTSITCKVIRTIAASIWILIIVWHSFYSAIITQGRDDLLSWDASLINTRCLFHSNGLVIRCSTIQIQTSFFLSHFLFQIFGHVNYITIKVLWSVQLLDPVHYIIQFSWPFYWQNRICENKEFKWSVGLHQIAYLICLTQAWGLNDSSTQNVYCLIIVYLWIVSVYCVCVLCLSALNDNHIPATSYSCLLSGVIKPIIAFCQIKYVKFLRFVWSCANKACCFQIGFNLYVCGKVLTWITGNTVKIYHVSNTCTMWLFRN